jgi:hypothetical protein
VIYPASANSFNVESLRGQAGKFLFFFLKKRKIEKMFFHLLKNLLVIILFTKNNNHLSFYLSKNYLSFYLFSLQAVEGDHWEDQGEHWQPNLRRLSPRPPSRRRRAVVARRTRSAEALYSLLKGFCGK